MGVPKFFRWLSERYPKVNQRLGRVALTETIHEHFGADNNDRDDGFDATPTTHRASSVPLPDPMSMCSTAPPIDRLYIDMNGIIHGCSHSNAAADHDGDGDGEAADSDAAAVGVTDDEIFRNVCFYLDRIVRDMVQPTSLVYMAIDGVAPRAKLNQQRSRRYRSGREGLIEQTIYDAHLKQIKTTELGVATTAANDDTNKLFFEFSDSTTHRERRGTDEEDEHDSVHEIEPGRFAGKFLARLDRPDRDFVKDPLLDASDTTNTTSMMNDTSSLDASTTATAAHTADAFHSNNITPGTPFFTRCTAHIQHFLQRKVSEDPAWQNLTIVFSGPNVPGEGEHKIMQFMREQRFAYEQDRAANNGSDVAADSTNNNINNDHSLAYHPNLRHCIMGQDGDLIMLGLLSHEPNLVLLREQVSFDMKLKEKATSTATALQSYIMNPNFELLHMNVLRDYFAYEFETSNVIPHSPWSLEHCLDDFVLMTFFVGNDFLPHMPAVDIADEAFDLLFYTYREQRKRWLKEFNSDTNNSPVPYLIDKGTIVSGQRLENFLQTLGKHETPYLEYKKSTDDIEKSRQLEAKYGMSTIPSDFAKDAKEAADRAVFRERITQQQQNGGTKQASEVDDEATMANADFLGEYDASVSNDDDSTKDHESLLLAMHYPNFRPVLTAASPPVKSKGKKKRAHDDDEEGDAEALSEHLGSVLRYSVKGGTDINISEEDLKGRYYSDKFGFSPFDAEKHLALRKAYIEGLVWNLKYYYEGCPSWDWYYPYHYGPMLSDLVGIDDMLKEISFEGKLGQPLRPFEQLMACMPPSHADVLPVPYRAFMTDSKSAIADFYPSSFTIDMNGKRWQWEAVVLLPFIDSDRLLEAVSTIDENVLTEDERKRNEFGGITVFSHDPSKSSLIKAVGKGNMFGDISDCTTKGTSFDDTPLSVSSFIHEKPIFASRLHDGVNVPLPGFPTLRDGTVQGLWRKLLRVNVHGSKSRYKTACLEIENAIPEILPAETLADHLNGTLLWINYPHFVEAYVTAVSDSRGVFRGKSSLKAWSPEDLTRRKRRISKIVNNYVFGEKMVGTGGVTLVGGEEAMDHLDILLYVRPFSGLKKLDDGTMVKTYAKFEVEVPLFVTGWAPQGVDPRLANLPVILERDPYRAAKHVLTDSRSDDRHQSSVFSKTLAQLSESRHQPTKRLNLARGFHSFSTMDAAQMLPRRETHSYSSAFSRQEGLNNHRCTTQFVSAPLTRRTAVQHARLPKTRCFGFPKGRVAFAGIAAAMAFFTCVCAADFGTRRNEAMFSRRTEIGWNTLQNNNFALFDSSASPMERAPTPPLEFAHGTTTLSFVFQGGIVAAVDSRATLGPFVGSKTTQKILPINTHMIGTMAGGAADCMYWIRKLRCEAAFYELSEGRRMSVAHASRLLSNILYELRGHKLSMATMILGFDETDDIPKIYYVDDTGIRIKGCSFAVGSGSSLALGILDTELRYDMSADEAVALGIKAIRHSTLRDAYSGGFINVYLITARYGWKRVYTEDLDQIVPDQGSYGSNYR